MPLTRAHRPLILVMGLLMAIGPMSIDMYLPALPTLAQDLEASARKVQWTLATYFLGLCLGQLIYGPLTDRYGRRKPLFAGLAVYVLASFACAFVQQVEALWVLRFFQAAGGGAAMVVNRAVVRDLFDPQTAAKVFSILMLIMGVAPILAPLLGGQVLELWGWRLIFVLLALFGVACLLAAWRVIPETASGPGLPLRASAYLTVLTTPGFLPYAIVTAMSQASLFAYIAGSPFVFISLYGLSPNAFAWLFGFNAFVFVAGSQLNRWLLGGKPMTTILRQALWVHTGAALLLLIVAQSRPEQVLLLLLPLALAIASLGLIFPNASAAALVPFSRQAGTASATLGLLQYAVAGVVILLVSDSSTSAMPMAVAMAAVALCSLASSQWAARNAPEVPAL